MGAGMTIATRCAIALVRAWTRLYTCGLPATVRTARRAEIDSDLWELEHDAEEPRRGRTAGVILIRLFAGVPDDVAWRMEIGATGRAVPARALAAAGMVTGPRRMSALGLSATMHVIGISAVVWLTSHGFLYWRQPQAVPQQAELWPPLQAFEVNVEVVPVPGQDGPPTVPNQFITTLLQNRYALEVGRGYLLGPGALVLQSAVRQSRFVLLGDDHDLGRISDLGSAICSATLPACDSVLMRVDALQVYRGLNPAGARGTGSEIALQAERQGLRSLHIRVFGDDGSQAPRALQLFLNRRLESKWTLFDLRPLRRDFNALAGRDKTELATLVFGIDMLVVVTAK